MQNNWERFWGNREDRPVDMYPFKQNFNIMRKILDKKFLMRRGLKSLEVGSGRGIMSDFLYGCGWDTYCVDKYYIPPGNDQKHKFFKSDALNLPFDPEFFDLVFSYGLLEHFTEYTQQMIMSHMKHRTKIDGMSLHYVVPKKITNYFEDDFVYRDRCAYFLNTKDILWVYPAIKLYDGQAWETYKWLAKGFWYEDTGFNNSEVNECKGTEQE